MNINQFIKQHNLADYRIKQFNLAYYQQLIESFDQLTTWSKNLREQLKDAIPFSRLKAVKEKKSADNKTIKVVFKNLADLKTEAVLMRFKDGRNSVCLSCMVGCPIGCKFCATGQMGFKANLTADEIVDQYLYFARLLKKENQHITNVVFMGMGEPLLNYDNVMEAVNILNEQTKIGLGIRRIIISTVGIVKGLKKLLIDNYKGRLALSLHSPNQNLREKLIPSATDNPLNQILQLIDQYISMTKLRVSFEYTLIKGVNDSNKNAKQLAKLVKNRLIHINLIPLNPVKDVEYKKPKLSDINNFVTILKKEDIPVTTRITMGDDIKAACGQLAT